MSDQSPPPAVDIVAVQRRERDADKGGVYIPASPPVGGATREPTGEVCSQNVTAMAGANLPHTPPRSPVESVAPIAQPTLSPRINRLEVESSGADAPEEATLKVIRDVSVPAYPSGFYRYRHDGRGWLVYEERQDGIGFRGSLVSHYGDPTWLGARFAEALDILAESRARVSQLEATVAELQTGYAAQIEHTNFVRSEYQSRLAAERATRHSVEQDALIVADFIVGYWPGLEDGISWGGKVDDHPAHRAGERILAARRATRERPEADAVESSRSTTSQSVAGEALTTPPSGSVAP